MMSKAGDSISSAISGLVFTLADLLNIDLLKEYNVGVQVVFVQPDARYEKVVSENLASASSMGAIVGIFLFASGGASLAIIYRPKKKIYNNTPPQEPKKDHERLMFAQEAERLRESTKPMTFKYSSTSANAGQRLDSVGNPIDFDNSQYQRENSLFQNQNFELNLRDKEVEEECDSLFWDFLKCFSIPINLYSLESPNRTLEDNPELDAVEGIKVLTM